MIAPSSAVFLLLVLFASVGNVLKDSRSTAVMVVASKLPSQPKNPVVGVFTNPLVECPPPPAAPHGQPPFTQCMEAYAANWLKAQAVRVVPFPWNLTDSEQLSLLHSVDGVYIPGGGISSSSIFNLYFARLSSVVEKAIQLNQNGIPVALWATCFGFELMMAAVAGSLNCIADGYRGMMPAMLPLQFTSDQPRSRVLGAATTPPRILHALQFNNSTLNWHTKGISTSAFKTFPKLQQFFSAVATSQEPVSPFRPFIALVEARNASFNIFGSQFHPDRSPFEFSNDLIGHSPSDLAVSHYFSEFVARLAACNRSNASFPGGADKVNRRSVDTLIRTYDGWGIQWLWM